MPIIGLLITLIVIGVLLYLLNTYVPMQPAIRNIINIVVVLVVIVWVLSWFFPAAFYYAPPRLK